MCSSAAVGIIVFLYIIGLSDRLVPLWVDFQVKNESDKNLLENKERHLILGISCVSEEALSCIIINQAHLPVAVKANTSIIYLILV